MKKISWKIMSNKTMLLKNLNLIIQKDMKLLKISQKENLQLIIMV